ncbi:MAG: pyrroline-5-carboxylate reductase [Spirochaetes bacterium]|nr:MAG: pyrroline-5-carboxylate reductase [Spirochaetota bacterium]
MKRLDNRTVGVIGTGNMGGALIQGLLRRDANCRIVCFDVDASRVDSLQREHGLSCAAAATDLVRMSDIVILAVKPDTVPAVVAGIREALGGKILVSIAAGVTLEALGAMSLPGQQIVRVMPNTPALLGEGMSVLAPNGHTAPEGIDLVEEVFACSGRTLILPEKLMNAVTGLSGSGPAYVFTFIQALADGGVKMGIPRREALMLAAQTVSGAAAMVLESNENPISLRGKVTSPGGTTIEGVHILERSGFSGIVMDAVEAATVKAAKLGDTKA